MGRLTNIDLEIARFYAPQLLDSVKLGESKICVWFPGGGKSTILRDIFGSKTILREYLKEIYPRLTIVFPVFSEVSLKEELTNNFGGETDPISLKKVLLEQIDSGNEVLFVIDKLEDLSTQKQMETLKELAELVNINPRRIHSIVNTFDIELVSKVLTEYPRAFSIANKISYLPLLSDQLLYGYIESKASIFDRKLSTEEKQELINSTGGILFLTKQLLREDNNLAHFNAKLRTIWMRLPEPTREAFLLFLLNNKASLTKLQLDIIERLKLHNALDLSVFRQDINILADDPQAVLAKIFSNTELKIYKKLTTGSQKYLSRDEVAQIIWGKKWEDNYSDWAIDATISRFRKKLGKAGFEPTLLKTIKGKGYKWEL